MLKQRILSAVIGLVILIPVLLCSQTVVNIALVLVIMFSLYELYKAFGFFEKMPVAVLGMLLPVLFVLGKFFLAQKLFYMPLLTYGYILLVFITLIVYHKDIKFSDMAVMFSMTFVITLFFSYIATVRAMEMGNVLIWSIFVGAFFPDSFAYFIGRAFGKHKLAPVVSPKKTVEGALGGLAGGVAFMLLFGFVVTLIFPSWEANYFNLGVMGLLCALVAEIGDLSMSAIKRDVGVKDFGNIMPGHGGLLDRLDSVLFVAPLVYLFASNFTLFVA